MPKKKTSAIYQLKITLQSSKPPIWRRVLVPSDMKLSTLHDVIQIAMGWEDAHLHQFDDGQNFYGLPEMSLDDALDSSKTKLEKVLPAEKAKILYEYDFGDSWEHVVLLEKILEPDPAQTYPVCIKGSRACPPEDCGGIWGYEDLLAKLADPKNPEREDLLDWLGVEDFDPDDFDLESINEELRA